MMFGNIQHNMNGSVHNVVNTALLSYFMSSEDQREGLSAGLKTNQVNGKTNHSCYCFVGEGFCSSFFLFQDLNPLDEVDDKIKENKNKKGKVC